MPEVTPSKPQARSVEMDTEITGSPGCGARRQLLTVCGASAELGNIDGQTRTRADSEETK